MPCIVFRTPGLIDLRAFTVMGMSAKPNASNPIGYFGTGLKYSMAVLVRLGCEPEVWIGRDRHVFVKTNDTFRGKDFEMLSMRSMRWGLQRWRTTKLPFTTQYGRNWEPWMVYRELEANTRDENGDTIYLDYSAKEVGLSSDQVMWGKDNETTIIVDLPAFVDAWRERDKVFLPNASRGGDMTLEVQDGPSDHLYWRGMRVHKLGKPSRFTYNFISHMMLTEDRTLMGDWYARSLLAQYIVKCNSDAIVEGVLTATDKFWEHGLDFDGMGEPGDGFKRIMARSGSRVYGNAWNYYAGYDHRVTEDTYQLDDHHPLPWKCTDTSVLDRNNREVFVKPPGYVGKWRLAAYALAKRVNVLARAQGAGDDEEPVGLDAENPAG